VVERGESWVMLKLRMRSADWSDVGCDENEENWDETAFKLYIYHYFTGLSGTWMAPYPAAVLDFVMVSSLA